MSEGDEVAVSLPMVQAESSTEGAQVYFKGSRKPCTKECVLIINAKTGEATLEKISDTVQLKVVRDGTERARSTKLLRDHSVSPIPAQQQQKQVVPPTKGQTATPAATNQTAPSSSTPQPPSERQTPTLQITPKAPKKVKSSAAKSPHQAPNKRKPEASSSVPAGLVSVPSAATTLPAVVMSQAPPSLSVQAPTPITPSPPVPAFFPGTILGIPTKKIKQSSPSTSDSSSSSSSSGSSSEGDSDSDALMSELQGEAASSSTPVAGLPMEVTQPFAVSDTPGGLPVVNPTNGQSAGPTTITSTTTATSSSSQPSSQLPATLQVPATAATAAGGGKFAGKMPTTQDNAVIGIMSSESGNSSSSGSSSDSSDSSDENDNEVANAFGYPSAPPPQRTISQLRTDLELSESGSDSEP